MVADSLNMFGSFRSSISPPQLVFTHPSARASPKSKDVVCRQNGQFCGYYAFGGWSNRISLRKEFHSHFLPRHIRAGCSLPPPRSPSPRWRCRPSRSDRRTSPRTAATETPSVRRETPPGSRIARRGETWKTCRNLAKSIQDY